MTSLKSISMSELVQRGKGKGLGVVKSGVGKGRDEDGNFIDPFTLGISYPVEFTKQKTTRRPTGTPQVKLKVSMMLEDGGLEPGGVVWLDLPVKEALSDLALTAPEEAQFLQKAGEKLGRFLRAIDPERYSVFKSIDKSDPENWKWLAFNGQELDADTRLRLAEEINEAVVAIAEGLFDGSISLVGARCVLTKQPNPHSPKYPYVNYSAFLTE